MQADYISLVNFPTLQGVETWTYPARYVKWRNSVILVPSIAISDPPHWQNKVRTRGEDYVLQIGNFAVDFSPLEKALRNFDFEKDTHLRVSDLHPDRMDFRASQRLFSPKIIAYLTQQCPTAKGMTRSQIFLQLIVEYCRFDRFSALRASDDCCTTRPDGIAL